MEQPSLELASLEDEKEARRALYRYMVSLFHNKAEEWEKKGWSVNWFISTTSQALQHTDTVFEAGYFQNPEQE